MSFNKNHTGKSAGWREWFAGGRFYFSREAERRFFFILTLVMAAIAIALRLGGMS